ncbi:acyl-CoA Delta-9 desaturase [Drosophila sulfurigaster albostrigata]|uniref:acyl-CoA Delta-9 desaturase n=1 Tax=Drosophila sulfurigaster albostrigata TaxID=89887 RepID=UPI002D21C68A|nr:acyl-CoA Delta-9 desaturase [Drosophila sulfurigaster albostrigata]
MGSTSQAKASSGKDVFISEADFKKRDAVWPLVLFYIHVYILGTTGIYIAWTGASWSTILFTALTTLLGILGVTVGVHRLWAHRTFTATAPLRLFLMLCQTMAGQGSIYSRVQAHRLHHAKFHQDEDPYYSKLGFLHAQLHGNLFRYSRQQEQLLVEIDMSDIESDKIVMLQKRFYVLLYIVLNVLVPLNTPFQYFGETFGVAMFVGFWLRSLIVLNVGDLVNSSHFVWGIQKDFKPTDSNSIFFITKSFWPQFHYLLPNDYQSGEFGDYAKGTGTIMIRVFAALNLAKDLRTISSVAVRKGLVMAVETKRPIVECIEEQVKLEKLPENHFLNREKFM